MVDFFEALMLTAFSVGWYFSIFKMLRTRQAAGKSLCFVLLITFGYFCGVASKTIEWSQSERIPPILYLYLWNSAILLFDATLVILFSRRAPLAAVSPSADGTVEPYPPDRSGSTESGIGRWKLSGLDRLSERDRLYHERLRLRELATKS